MADSDTRARPARAGTRRKTAPAKEPLPASIVLRQPRSGEGRRIKVGFAWDLFLFAGLFGVPLFLRGLHAWGAAILALWLFDLALGWAGGSLTAMLQTALFVAFLALQLWLGFRGNVITARMLLERGWTLDEREPAAARQLVERWAGG